MLTIELQPPKKKVKTASGGTDASVGSVSPIRS